MVSSFSQDADKPIDQSLYTPDLFFVSCLHLFQDHIQGGFRLPDTPYLGGRTADMTEKYTTEIL